MEHSSDNRESSNQTNEDTSAKDINTDDVLPSNRFELELEFIQCLASPAYLHNLATTGLLSDPEFLSFLEYLTYWKTPEYVRFITYPHALHFLDLILNNERFRREIANMPFRNFVHEQQYYAWQSRNKNLYGAGLQQEQKPEQEQQKSNITDQNEQNDMQGQEVK